MKPTQINDVLIHLQKHGTITSNEAFELYGATRLSAVILELRKHHIITTEMTEGETRYGRPCRYATYCYWGKKGNAESAT